MPQDFILSKLKNERQGWNEPRFSDRKEVVGRTGPDGLPLMIMVHVGIPAHPSQSYDINSFLRDKPDGRSTTVGEKSVKSTSRPDSET